MVKNRSRPSACAPSADHGNDARDLAANFRDRQLARRPSALDRRACCPGQSVAPSSRRADIVKSQVNGTLKVLLTPGKTLFTGGQRRG
jgi:hypothetical protein